MSAKTWLFCITTFWYSLSVTDMSVLSIAGFVEIVKYYIVLFNYVEFKKMLLLGKSKGVTNFIKLR